MGLLKINHNDLIKEKLDICIERACFDLYINDYNLIVNGEYKEDHIAERSIVFRFGIYLDKHLAKFKCLNKYHLDAEYNRDIDDLKCIPSRANGCSPDLIIHKRGSNNDNLLLIERKGWWSLKGTIIDDCNKIRDFMENKEFKYRFGLLIIFKKNGVSFKWIDKNKDRQISKFKETKDK